MLNKLTIQGKIFKDFEVKTSESGVDYAHFTISWYEKYKDKKQKCYINCVAYGHNAKFLEKFFSKGDMVLVEGKLLSVKYDDHGHEKWANQLHADSFHFCVPKGQVVATDEDSEDEDEEVLPF